MHCSRSSTPHAELIMPLDKSKFPYVAAIVCTCLVLAVLAGQRDPGDGSTTLPLFTLLAMSEFAFFTGAIGAYIGFRHRQTKDVPLLYSLSIALCAVLSLAFLVLGFKLWPL